MYNIVYNCHKFKWASITLSIKNWKQKTHCSQINHRNIHPLPSLSTWPSKTSSVVSVQWFEEGSLPRLFTADRRVTHYGVQLKLNRVQIGKNMCLFVLFVFGTVQGTNILFITHKLICFLVLMRHFITDIWIYQHRHKFCNGISNALTVSHIWI